MSEEKNNKAKVQWKPKNSAEKPRFVLRPRKTEREFAFTSDEFKTLSDFVHKKTGIVLKDHKMNMVYSRLARRLRTLGIESFGDYLVYLNGSNGEAEISSLINAITTNLTKFFRENHHFEHLSSVVLPEIIKKSQTLKNDKIRIWSAGCSSGEEPYSISMVLDTALKNQVSADFDAKILATDLDTNMLKIGRDGLYKTTILDEVGSQYHPYFEESPLNPNTIHMAHELRQKIAFKELNLLSNWPMKGPFDVIFCRNVMIYFDSETKRKLTERFYQLLRPGGWLYIGHSETLLGADNLFKLHGRTIYQRPY